MKCVLCTVHCKSVSRRSTQVHPELFIKSVLQETEETMQAKKKSY